MRKCLMQCGAAGALAAVAVACSSPPMGIDGRATGLAGGYSDLTGAISVANADGAAGCGGSASLDAGTGAFESSALDEAGDGNVLSRAPAPDAGDAGSLATIGSETDRDAQISVPPVVEYDASDARQTLDWVVVPEGGAISVADGSSRDDSGARPCTPAICGTHSWACWRMPNSPRSGLPNPASYTDMGDGTVRDNLTCLVWQKVAPYTTAYTWEEAKLKCANQPFLEGTGWRLPTRIELMSIVDYSRRGPSVVVSVFPSTQLNPPYWTWSRFAGASQHAYTIGFFDGTLSYADQTSMYFARCVRGNGENPDLPTTPPPDHYDIGLEEVIDNYTGLIWQRGDSQSLSLSGISSDTAVTYCETLNLQGKGWRLPSIKELATLIDETRLSHPLPAVDLEAFPTTAADDYWTSTTLEQNRWSVSFRDGRSATNRTTGFARCVR